MPIPFLIAAAAVAVGGLGVVGGVVAKETMDEAKAVGAEGESIIRRAERRRNDARDETNEAVNDLGMKKLDILSGSIKVFVENFSKMKNVNFKDSAGMEELLDFTPQSDALGQLKQNSLTALEIGGSLATGVAGSGVAALGAYGAVSVLGVASTGTAISALSGAAATNATLAWLGGGSLAAGGLGVAGGMAVLGGVVLAPALLIGSFLMYSKAEEALNKAKTYREKAWQFEAECENACSLLAAIKQRAEQIVGVLDKLDHRLAGGNDKLVRLIAKKGEDWNAFSEADKKVVAGVAMTAKTLKVIMDTPLLHEDGALAEESQEILSLPMVQQVQALEG